MGYVLQVSFSTKDLRSILGRMSNSPLGNNLRPFLNLGMLGKGICSKIFFSLILLVALWTLTGCAGISTGSSNQTPTGTISLANGSLAFGSVKAGSSKTVSTTVTNSGSAAVTINSVSISTKYFALSAPSLPVTVAAGQSVPVSVVFSPNAAGTFSASASISSTASDSVTSLALSGTGTTTLPPPGQLALSATSESFGSVTVGSSHSATITVTNSGGTSLEVSQVAVSGNGFQVSGFSGAMMLNASQSTTFSVSFAPKTAGSVTGSVVISSNGSNPTLTIPLSGNGTSTVTPGQLALSAASESFGNVAVGASQSATITVTNSGGTSDAISQIAVSGTGFQISGVSAPVTLNASQSATFSVSFAPKATGSASGSVVISSNGSNPTLTIPLSGNGTSTATPAQLGVSPSTLGVGSVVVGTSGTASGTLQASGGSVTVTGATSNSSVFVISGLSLPVTIPAGQSVPFTITFSPQVSGAAGATLTFTSNAQPSSTTESLTGSGTAAPTYSVNLSWAASTSANVSGYNIYRAQYSASCGAFKKLNAQINTGTLYTDSTVTDGTSYCYAATTVTTDTGESGYSNIVSNIQIPAP